MNNSISNKTIWNIAYPIIFGNLAQTLITFVDTAFLGHLGRVELGASMMAGLYYYVFSTLAWGFAIGVQIIVARRLGENKLAEVGNVFNHGLLIVALLSMMLFSLLHFFTNNLLIYIIDSPNIYIAALEYMKYRHYGIIFVCFNFLFRSLYVGLSNTKVITYTTILMAVVNIVLDYCLIFGKLGFSKMGVGGAAIASVCAEFSALVFFVFYTVRVLPVKVYHIFKFVKIQMLLLRSMLKLALPTMLQRLLSFGVWFVFFAMIEKMGELPIAISGIVRSVYMLVLVPVFAYSAAANTLTSQLIGAGMQNEVHLVLKKIIRLSLATVLPLVLLCVFIPETLASIYTEDLLLAEASVPVLYVVCIGAVTSCFGYTFFEAVSGTGNTLAALILEVGVLLVYLLFIFFSTKFMNIQFVWCAEVLYAVLLGAFSAFYLKNVNWQKKAL